MDSYNALFLIRNTTWLRYSLISEWVDYCRLFESQEDDSIKDKILAEYSHPKLYEEDDKNKIIQRVKRRIERNYEVEWGSNRIDH